MDDLQKSSRQRSQRWMLLVLATIMLTVGGVWYWLRGMQNELIAKDDLADFGAVPNVTLVERSGKKIALDELRGTIWIADFIFTRCGGTCLTMSAKMSDLQKSLVKAKNVKLISFTVDPEYDTPGVLDDYSKRYNADSDRWLFVRASREQIQDLAVNKFHLALEEGNGAADAITHSSRFVLVDADGHIRGYYDAAGDKEATQHLLTDLGMLMRGDE